MKLTDETYERLREQAKSLGFMVVAESDEAQSFMQGRTSKERYEEWRTKHPNDDIDIETWLAKVSMRSALESEGVILIDENEEGEGRP